MIFLMLKILHLFVLMELDPSFPTRLCPCQSAHPASLLHCGSHWGFLQDKMMTLCLKQLGCFLSLLSPFFLSGMPLLASQLSAHREMSNQGLNLQGSIQWLRSLPPPKVIGPASSSVSCLAPCKVLGLPLPLSPGLRTPQGEPHFYSSVSLLLLS